MNDIVICAPDVNTVMYADDRIVQRTKLALSYLELWFKRNHLTLNEQKTQFTVTLEDKVETKLTRMFI